MNSDVDSSIPSIGLGTFRLKGEDAYNAVRTALKLGYRHIDTAQIYDNEQDVGRARPWRWIRVRPPASAGLGSDGNTKARRPLAASIAPLGLVVAQGEAFAWITHCARRIWIRETLARGRGRTGRSASGHGNLCLGIRSCGVARGCPQLWKKS